MCTADRHNDSNGVRRTLPRLSWEAHAPASSRRYLLLLFVLLLAAACADPHDSSPTSQSQPAGTDAVVSVNPGSSGLAVPAGFVGLGFETSEVCDLLSADAQGPALSNLLSNFGHSTLRFGGNSVERAVWDSTGTPSCSYSDTVITPATIDGVFALARKVSWKVIWGLNLEHGDPANAAAEAAYAVAAGGTSLLALEIGNEPDLYGWDYATFMDRWQESATAITATTPSAPLAGPATCCGDTDWVARFVQSEGARLAVVTHHLYPLGPNDPSQTVAKMLGSDSMARTGSEIGQVVAAAKARGLPAQIDESNNISEGGTPGVSNVFASALWGADYLFTAAEHGASGVNLFGGDTYEPLHITNSGVSVRPLYYGMLLFHAAAGPGGTLVPVRVTSPLNMAAHAIVGRDGKLRLVLINKSLSTNVTVQVDTTKSYARATTIRLSAPSVSAPDGITLGGSPVAADGTWTPTSVAPASVNGASSSISLPAASAVMIAYS